MRRAIPITYNMWDDPRSECNPPFCRHSNCKSSLNKLFATPFTVVADVVITAPYNIAIEIKKRSKSMSAKTAQREETNNAQREKLIKFNFIAKECEICYEPIRNNMILTYCCSAHKYHKECIDNWNAISNECPYCRRK